VLEAEAASGLTTREYCRRHTISEPSFYSWRRKLQVVDRREKAVSSSKPAKPAAVVPVHVTGVVPRRIEILDSAGIVVRLPEDCSAETICRVLGALREGETESPC
jgi:transposase-like protein